MISRNKILTAAHCGINDDNLAVHSVVIGATHFKSVKRYPIVRVFNHEKFGTGARGDPLNDIAILEVHRGTDKDNNNNTSNSNYYYPTVNSNYSLPLDHERLYVSGFGRTETNSDTSNILRTTSVRVLSKAECSVAINNITLDNRICALSPGRDACTGDSGGPLYAYNSNNNNINRRAKDLVIYGIVSFGIKCAHPTVPGIYVRVSRYSDWISAVLAIAPTPYRSVRSVITILILAGIAFLALITVVAALCCVSKRREARINSNNNNNSAIHKGALGALGHFDTNDTSVRKKTPWFQSPKKPLPVAFL